MRLIIMRHGESQNNVLAKIDDEIYESTRTAEPELSEQGVKDCRALGARLKEMGLKIDHMITSPHKRAVLSLKNVREAMDATDVPC